MLPRKPASCEQELKSDTHLVSLDLGFPHPLMKQHTCMHPPSFQACGD